MSSYKLHYWNAKGGAESIRIIFAQTGVKYEDVRFEREEWGKQYKLGMAIALFVGYVCYHESTTSPGPASKTSYRMIEGKTF